LSTNGEWIIKSSRWSFRSVL